MKVSFVLLCITMGIAILILLGIFGVCTANVPKEAQNAEIVISNNATTNKSPAIVYNPDRDEYLVVWRSRQADGYDIRGQRLDSSGVLVGTDFTITTPISTSWPCVPAVAYNTTRKEFLVVWSNEISGNLHAQRVLSNGVRANSSFTISTSLSDDPHGATLAYAPDSDVFLLAWRGCIHNQQTIASPNGGNPCYFYTQVLDGEGTRVGENITATTSTYMQGYPTLAYVPNLGEFWIVWTEQYTITAQRILTTGLLFNEPVALAQETTDMYNPSISDISDRGEFLVTWEKARDVLHQPLIPAGGGYRDIYARRVLSNGMPAGNSFRVSSTSVTAMEPKVTYPSGQGQYLVVWGNYDYQGHHRNIYARWISETGKLVGYDFPIAVAPEDQFYVAMDGENMVLVVWQDNRGGPDIRGRILERAWWLYLPLVMRAG